MAIQKFQCAGTNTTQDQQTKNTEGKRTGCRLIHNRLAKNTFKSSGSIFDWNLAQFASGINKGTSLHAEIIDWFLTLPLWLDLPGLRVVHACWHDEYMAELEPLLGQGRTLTHELMVRASRSDDLVFRAIEGLTKGLEVALPPGHSFRDKDGHERRNVRIRWWDEQASSYRDLALMPEGDRAKLPDMQVTEAKPSYDQKKPVFFGHYWMHGEPTLQADRMACVDYSAGKGGPLVAYRWSGEETLDPRNFVSTASSN